MTLDKGARVFYFAYACNLSKKDMAARCPECKPKFSAVLPNYRLVFVGWSRQWRGGIASIKHSNGDKVQGAVYELTEKDLRRLDTYEGFPATSTRLNVTVFTDDNQAVKAVTYMRSGQLDETAPSKEYVAVIQQGYKDWGIS